MLNTISSRRGKLTVAMALLTFAGSLGLVPLRRPIHKTPMPRKLPTSKSRPPQIRPSSQISSYGWLI